MKSILHVLRGFIAWFLLRRHGVALFALTIFMSLGTSSCATSPERLGGRYCDSSEERPGFPTCLPASNVFFCERGLERETGGRDRAYVGQFFPSKPFLGPAQPNCPPNAEQSSMKEDLRIAKEGAFGIGKQAGVALASCDIAMQSLTNQTDHHLAVYQKALPKTEALVLANCANDLAAIPELPAYESSELAGVAQKAFEEGVNAGVDEVFHRILAIEAALTIVEVAIWEAAPLIEVAATRGIRRGLVALSEMPVFVPMTVDGAGVVVSRVAKGSSRALARNMKKVKRFRLPGEFAHHIVAHGDQRAQQALEILERFGINVDDEVNGVFLPGYKTSPNKFGKVVHGNLHTKAYYDAVNARLVKARTADEVKQFLRDIAHELEHGMVPQ